MTTTKIIIILLIAGAVIGSILYSGQDYEPGVVEDVQLLREDTQGNETEAVLSFEEEVPDAVSDSEDLSLLNEDAASPASETESVLEDDIPANLTAALQEGTPVLFFHASWCPTCRALAKELEERSDEIPSNISVVTVDYDSEKELRRRYNITRQHTLVVLDSNLEQVGPSWEGGGVDEILNRFGVE
ncbi:MAG: thioredoxin family protein [Candidatus Kaiserbacteria bacterium]|nr:thioredoxin family protein [Candidatus Kaiserbacteria bacterium]